MSAKVQVFARAPSSLQRGFTLIEIMVVVIIIGLLAAVVHVPMLRRRLPVVFVSESARPVKMRHVSQNLGSPVSETQPIQSPRV